MLGNDSDMTWYLTEPNYVYECENCGYVFEAEEPKCPICHSEDVIEYEEGETNE